MIARSMEFATAGDRALLVTFDGMPPRAAARAIRELPHVVACVTGHESLLVVCDRGPDAGAIAAAIAGAVAGTELAARAHRIEVSFDGVDLDELLARIAIPRNELLERIRDVRLTVRYLGFRAGFAYCDGWPEPWRMPRRPTSRNRVPGGTFAIAGAMAGFYPVDSPGGWNLLGMTNAPLWDPAREPPNLFDPGDVIELVPTPSLLPPAPLQAGIRQPSTDVVAEVVSPGQLTTIAGPRDWQRVTAGVTPGGRFDEAAALLANRAAGNAATDSLLECVLVAPALRFRRECGIVFCDGALHVHEQRMAAGEELRLERFHGGLRGYLAIEGGIDDGRGRWDDAITLKRGDVLRTPEGTARDESTKPILRDSSSRLTLSVILGPHQAPPLPERWEVTNQLNRVGIRLRPIGNVPATLPADLPSCGMQFGTLQWHPDGSLIAMGPDHPVTGGYLQPATVISEDLWKLGQLTPGDVVTIGFFP
jgi:KipI family sensor histidine kinase inhibitor